MASSSRLKYRPNSPKAILMLLLIFGVAIIGISASGFHYTINTVAGASSSVTFDWSQARGVDYRWSSSAPGKRVTHPSPQVKFTRWNRFQIIKSSILCWQEAIVTA